MCVLVVILSSVPRGEQGMLTAAKLQVSAGENNRSVCPCSPNGYVNALTVSRRSQSCNALGIFSVKMASLELNRYVGYFDIYNKYPPLEAVVLSGDTNHQTSPKEKEKITSQVNNPD